MQKIIKWNIYLLLFLSPFFLGKLFLFYDTLGQIFILIIFLLWLIKGWNEKTLKIYLPREFLLFFLFLFVSILSLFFSVNYFSSRNEILRLCFLGIFFLLILNNLDEKNKENIFLIIVISTFLASVYGICLYILLSDPNYLIFSTFFNPNCLAAYLILVIPLILAKFLTEDCIIIKHRFCMILFILTLCLILTVSRGAWLSLLLGLFILFFLERKKIKISHSLFILFLSVIILFLILLLTKPIISQRIVNFFNFQDRSHLFRSLVLKSSINLIKIHPIFGWGIGSFESVYPNYKLGGCNTKLAHNTYIQMFVELGIIGGVIFLFFIFSIIKKMYIIVKEKDDLSISSYFSAILIFLIHNIFDYHWYVEATSLLFFTICSLIFLHQEKKFITFSLKKKSVLYPYLFFILFLVIIILSVIPISFASFYAEKGEDYEEKRNFIQASENYKKSTSLDSISPEYHFYLGRIYRITGKLNLAEEELHRALCLQKISPFYHFELGMVYLAKKDNKKAIYYFEKAKNLHKNYTAPLRELGDLYLKMGEINLSEKEFKKILKIEKNPYEQDKYQPISGRKKNPDFLYAHKILKEIEKKKNGN